MKTIPSGLKNLFLVHFIVALVLGLVLLVIPGVWRSLIGQGDWVQVDLYYRLIGAAMLGYGASSWLAYRATDFSKIEILLPTEVVWCALGTVVMVYGLLTRQFPSFGWVNAILLAGFGAGFAYYAWRK